MWQAPEFQTEQSAEKHADAERAEEARDDGPYDGPAPTPKRAKEARDDGPYHGPAPTPERAGEAWDDGSNHSPAPTRSYPQEVPCISSCQHHL